MSDSVAGKGKYAFWKAFQDSIEGYPHCSNEAGNYSLPMGSMMTQLPSIEQFICTVYQRQTKIVSVKKLRWWLSKKKQAESERLPPSRDAPRQAIVGLHAHHQAMSWNHDTVSQPVIPSPEYYRWKQECNIVHG